LAWLCFSFLQKLKYCEQVLNCAVHFTAPVDQYQHALNSVVILVFLVNPVEMKFKTHQPHQHSQGVHGLMEEIQNYRLTVNFIPLILL